jgi:geranylgeranyl diphosphate synthase type II
VESVSVPRLRAASAHLLGRGKLYRPLLLLATYEALGGVDGGKFIDVAAAVEVLHTSTLIHDDLPSLDDASLRRGINTVHREFDEATAILAGDLLLNLAFKCVLDCAAAGSRRLVLLRALSRATTEVMEGQALDIAGEGQASAAVDLEMLYRKKTGAILGACCEMGALLADAGEDTVLKLRRIGVSLGIGFQVRDDLLSITGTEADTGKTLSVDQTKDKATLPRVLGCKSAERYAAEILAETSEALAALNLDKPDLLRAVALLAVDRRR